MSCLRARLAALAIAMFCAAGVQAQGQGLQLRRPSDKPSGVNPDSLPVTVDADRLEGDGDVLTGPALKYRVRDATGVFEKPDFTFVLRAKSGRQPVTARGQAESIELLGEKRFRIKDGFFTSCKPGDDGWFIRADELDLDFTREVGTARGGGVYFKGVHII